MAFSTGFQSVQKHNIRNIYSTSISLENRTMKRKVDNQRKSARKPVYVDVKTNSNFITYEYVPEYKAYIPKAPAFRTVSGSKATEISKRLYTPRMRTPIQETESEVKSLHPEPSSYESQNCSVERLSQPTVASYIRLRMRSANERKMKVTEISKACDRLNLPPSQRYFPMAYKNWLNVNGTKSMRSSFLSTNTNRSSLDSLDYDI
ncbi:unnamed protein product [Mytilus coruscus]|uniref:Uncharacterized protein n=1 Tax=Mytilus coruscus TaxID=42192 RepID=A0A6J8D2Z3_MYTCO|nr:unnamed protein product [Mytilus coruscus]